MKCDQKALLTRGSRSVSVSQRHRGTRGVLMGRGSPGVLQKQLEKATPQPPPRPSHCQVAGALVTGVCPASLSLSPTPRPGCWSELMLGVQGQPEEAGFQMTCLLPAPITDPRTQDQQRRGGSSWREEELRGEGSKFQKPTRVTSCLGWACCLFRSFPSSPLIGKSLSAPWGRAVTWNWNSGREA